MSRLSSIKKPEDRPVIMTVAGEAGVGKTSFAATFPNPIFIQAEEGMQSIPFASRPDAFPAIKSGDGVEALWSDLGALIREDHDYKTLVIDSVTALESIFIEHLIGVDSGGVESLAKVGGGYGAGYQMLASMHHRVRKAAGMLRDKGMHVVFIAHTDIENIDPPDGAPYTRFSLRLSKRSLQPYIDNVDAVGFISLEKFHKAADKKERVGGKAFSTDTRVMTLRSSVAHVSKNRFGITEDIEIVAGENAFLKMIASK